MLIKKIKSSLYFFWLLFLYGGALLVLSIFLFEDEEIKGMLFFFGILFSLIAQIFYLILLYQVWRFFIIEYLINDWIPTINTPSKVIWFLFIPFYNLYWTFIVFERLVRDINWLIQEKKLNIPLLSRNLGAIIPSILVGAPFLSVFLRNYHNLFLIVLVIECINFYLLMPYFLYQVIQRRRDYENNITN